MSDNNQNKINEFDISGQICVTNMQDVANEVMRLLAIAYPNQNFAALGQAFQDFELLYDGRYKRFRSCETLYHDKQHTLDMTLTMARILVSHHEASQPFEQLGAARAELGLITALFHDAGYIRHRNDWQHKNGAEYTQIHVTRSGNFLADYLPTIGRDNDVDVARILVHFTGYELDPRTLLTSDAKNRVMGYALGSADLIAQMADRCYLEKCLERLYPEFVVGGLAQIKQADGSPLYHSKYDLIRKTPAFAEGECARRLDGIFGSIHEYMRNLFDGRNLYMESIDIHVKHAKKISHSNDFSSLRRILPETAGTDDFPNLENYLEGKESIEEKDDFKPYR